MLFVQDDQPQAGQRCEYGATGTDDDLHLAAANSLPLEVPLRGRHLAMQDRDFRESSLKTTAGLRGQADLGDQYDRPPTELDDVLDRADVDFRFTATGHTVQQQRLPRTGIDRRMNRLQGLRLVGRQSVRFLRLAVPLLKPRRCPSRHLTPSFFPQQPFVPQPANRVLGTAECRDQLRRCHRSPRRDQMADNRLLLRR